ncbi:MAG: histone deacetylase [Polyangiaceae bacterium]
MSSLAPGLWVADEPACDEHRAKGYHPERPERLAAARQAIGDVAAGGINIHRVVGRDATRAELERVHEPHYLDLLHEQTGLYAALDDDTYVGPKSVAAAYRAAGSAAALVDAILDAKDGEPTVGAAIVRPPGHHARPGRGMGFCLVNNVAVAARHARSRGLDRVAIVDWDVHHGNGTQDIFYSDPSVLFVSLHQYPFYPGTGAVNETGEGDGRGFTVNVPLSPSATDSTYRTAFDRVVLPVVEQFAPQMIFVSAGFDAHARDPLAGMALSEAGYRVMARALRGLADRVAGGRVAVLLEGGYDLEALEASLAATLEEVARPAAPVTHANPPASEGPTSMRHGVELERARKIASSRWRL